MTEEEPLYIDTKAMLAMKGSLAAKGIAMSLVFEVWWPTKEPFAWDPQALAAKLSAQDATAEALSAERDDVARFFTVLPDGRWAPSPELFSLTNGNPGRAS